MATVTKFAVLGHMGLGDAIVQKGILRHVAACADEVLFFGKTKYLESLKSILDDIPNLRIVPVQDDDSISPAMGADGRLWKKVESEGFAVLPLGYHTGSRDWLKLDDVWNKCLYRSIGLDPLRMYSSFGTVKIDAAKNRELFESAVAQLQSLQYAVVHDDASRGMIIQPDWLPRDLPLIHVDDPCIRTDNICDYILLLSNAKECHFIDSCFANLADFYFEPWIGPKRYVHTTQNKSKIHPTAYRGAELVDHHLAVGTERLIAPDGTKLV